MIHIHLHVTKIEFDKNFETNAKLAPKDLLVETFSFWLQHNLAIPDAPSDNVFKKIIMAV